MKTYFIENEFKYDGSQLKGLFAYLNYGVLGDSIVSWVGSCEVNFSHMVDGEDLLAKSEIRGDKMVHFIVEKFDVSLFSAVGLQRLLASLVIDVLGEMSPANRLHRDGDDVYMGTKKLSISIATLSRNSALIHFAVNVVNEGTPVETLCLNDLSVSPITFAKKVMDRFSAEVRTITEATQKVRCVD